MVPHGFAHGFSVLSATASVIYKVDQCIIKKVKEGFDMMILHLRSTGLDANEIIVSEKDLIYRVLTKLLGIFKRV
jgi:dTDP-4-dehydrorhamnose 3,5-epimerase